MFFLDIFSASIYKTRKKTHEVFYQLSCADPEGGGGGTGGPDPPSREKYKNIGFLSNTGLDPLKITKLPIQHSM